MEFFPCTSYIRRNSSQNFYDPVRKGQKSKLRSFRGWSYTALRRVIWMAEQCSGIAHGLTRIHHYETWRRTNSMNVESKPGAAARQDHLRDHAGRIKPENTL